MCLRVCLFAYLSVSLFISFSLCSCPRCQVLFPYGASHPKFSRMLSPFTARELLSQHEQMAREEEEALLEEEIALLTAMRESMEEDQRDEKEEEEEGENEN